MCFLPQTHFASTKSHFPAVQQRSISMAVSLRSCRRLALSSTPCNAVRSASRSVAQKSTPTRACSAHRVRCVTNTSLAPSRGIVRPSRCTQRSGLSMQVRKYSAASSAASSSAPKVPMDLLKQLRGETGAPLGDVKEALALAFSETGSFDLATARDNLRKKGMATAAKRAGKEATEGMVGLCLSDDKTIGVLVEVTAETDFVARSEQFQGLVALVTQSVMTHVAENKSDTQSESLSAEVVDALPTATGTLVSDAIADVIALLKENIKVGRASVVRVEAGAGAVAGYMHNKAPGAADTPKDLSIGRHAALVAINTSNTSEGAEFGQKMAMHIVAASPSYLATNHVPEEVVEQEKKILRDEILTATPNKPANVVEKIITGRVNKYFGENVLLEQVYMLDEMEPADGAEKSGKNANVKAVLKNMSKSLGSPVEIGSFVRVQVGN